MFNDLSRLGKYLGQAARLMVGMPDYDNYVEHMQITLLVLKHERALGLPRPANRPVRHPDRRRPVRDFPPRPLSSSSARAFWESR